LRPETEEETMSDRNYTVQTKIQRPVAEVFDAIVNKNTICKFFTDKTSGPLQEGQRITWTWDSWGDYPVIVKRITENALIHLEIDSLEWKKTEDKGYKVDVLLELESLDDGSTMLSISERGWLTDESGLKGSHDNCSGWTHMAMCLKAFVEHGIDMR
jgi:uncharacterized protein YndB with AHSA1/START domain